MSTSTNNSFIPEEIELAAAEWVIRLERGLEPTEQAELDVWLAADPRHWTALAEHRDAWHRFEPLAKSERKRTVSLASNFLSPDGSSAPPRQGPKTRWLRILAPTLTVAAAIALGIFLRTPPPAADSLASLTAPCERRVLEDGSVIQLDRSALVTVVYTPTERRVTLRRGKAHFAVAKNHDRPFTVTASGVSVRAVGTAFDVSIDSSAVAVLVTEGTVQVKKPEQSVAESLSPTAPSPAAPLVTVGQLAIVSLAPTALVPEVATLSAAELESRSAWQPRLLNYDDTPLAVIVGAFNQRNGVQMTIDDATLGNLRMTVSIRSDNLAGFVRLLEGNFGVRAGSGKASEIVLRRN